MAQTHAFDFLETPGEALPEGLCVALGDDRYLKWMVRQVIDRMYEQSGSSAVKRWSGRTDWRDIVADLSAPSLFGPPVRVGWVEDADRLVSENRKKLESFATGEGPPGTLILDVSSWPGNTKLYRMVAERGLAIDCGLPATTRGKSRVLDQGRLRKWLVARAKRAHQLQLSPDAALYLIEHSPPELGIMDQELARLAVLIETDTQVEEKLIRQHVGGWRAQTVFELADAALEGHAAEALLQLDRLMQSGQEPLALFGAITWSLRRYAGAAQRVEQLEAEGRRVRLSEVITQAGFRPWDQQAAQRRLRRLGRRRALELPAQLLATDLALKGSHSAPHTGRLALEKLVLWVAMPAET